MGHLIGEYNANGGRIVEYLWLGDRPIAALGPNGAVFYVLSDHLGTPRQVIDSNKQLRWTWDNSDPFGNNAANANPTGLGGFAFNLRFAGQSADSESGLFYNYFREYDPRLGRFVESDPVGLRGGLNTYSYAINNTLGYVDYYGLDAQTLHIQISIPFVGSIEAGFFATDGYGDLNYLPDLGVYGSVSESIDGYMGRPGVGSFKIGATVGYSKTLGCRDNFDGVDANLAVGFGSIGGSLGGFTPSSYPTSGSIEFGPQLGFEAQKTLTGSLSIGDLARGAAYIFNGDGGRIFGTDCGCSFK